MGDIGLEPMTPSLSS